MKDLAIKVAWRTAILVAACAAVALGVNAARPAGGIPLVAPGGYWEGRIFKPCPEVMSEPEPIGAFKLRAWSPDSVLVVDARPEEQYARGHREGAIGFPYSVLFSPEQDEVKELARMAGKRTIVVCGDEEMGTGRLLASELMDAGLTQVYFVQGGCEALAASAKAGGSAP